MRTYRRIALLALAMTVTAPAFAHQEKKPTAPASGKTNTKAAATTDAASSDVVGRVGGKTITWDQLVARIRNVNPQQFVQAVGQALGASIGNDLFGPNAKPQVTLTRASALASLRKNPPPFMVNYLNQMLQEEVLLQAAQKANALPTDTQVEAFMTRTLKQFRERENVPPQTTDEQWLASRGITKSAFRAQVRPYLAGMNLVAKDLEKQLGHPLGPDDYLQARHILLPLPPPAPDEKPEDKDKAKQEVKTKLAQIAEEIKSGKKSFEDAASEFGTDATKSRGGDLGPFVRGAMIKEFEAAAFALKPGEVSEPVETQFGFHLIKVEKVGKDLTAEQRATAMEQYAGGKFPTMLQNLQASANAVNELQKMMPAPQPGAFPGRRPPGAGAPPGR